jgi:sugar phosphate isomerase/epimerase
MLCGGSIAFEDYPLEELLHLMRDVGFDKVEMWKPQLKRCKTPELRGHFVDYAQRIGLSMGGLNVVGEPYYKPFGTDSELNATLEGLKADVDYGLSLGVHDVLIWEGVRPQGITDLECRDRLLPRLAELFRAAIAFAAPRGARFLIEPHPFTVGIDNDFTIHLYETLDTPHFGVLYDCCHYGVGQPRDYVKAIHKLGPRIHHIHFADSDQKSSELHFALGAGKLDLDAILRAFKEVKYAGTLTLDVYGNPLPVQAARQSIPRLRAACEFLGLSG